MFIIVYNYHHLQIRLFNDMINNNFVFITNILIIDTSLMD